jgi:SAM-dependent methyltransferase
MASVSPARYHLNQFVRELERGYRELFTLDLGCKNSPYGDQFSNRVGMDRSAASGVDVVADALQLPFRAESFECVFCTEMLEHVPDPATAVGEIRRILRLGGVCILTTRFCYPVHDAPHDYFRYTEHGLRHLFEDWEIVRLDADTSAVATAMTALQTAAVDGRSGSIGQRLFANWVWRPVWKLFFRLYPGFSPTHGSRAMPAGYHLIAIKT